MVRSKRPRLDARPARGVSLRVAVDQQRALLGDREAGGEVHGGRRLTDSALLVCDRDDACHVPLAFGVFDGLGRALYRLGSEKLRLISQPGSIEVRLEVSAREEVRGARMSGWITGPAGIEVQNRNGHEGTPSLPGPRAAPFPWERAWCAVPRIEGPASFSIRRYPAAESHNVPDFEFAHLKNTRMLQIVECHVAQSRKSDQKQCATWHNEKSPPSGGLFYHCVRTGRYCRGTKRQRAVTNTLIVC